MLELLFDIIRTAIECEPLPAIANGVITYAPNSVSAYSLGTTATYSCNTGFSLDLSAGSEARTCVDDGDNDAEGVFDGQAPTCVRKLTEYILCVFYYIMCVQIHLYICASSLFLAARKPQV